MEKVNLSNRLFNLSTVLSNSDNLCLSCAVSSVEDPMESLQNQIPIFPSQEHSPIPTKKQTNFNFFLFFLFLWCSVRKDMGRYKVPKLMGEYFKKENHTTDHPFAPKCLCPLVKKMLFCERLFPFWKVFGMSKGSLFRTAIFRAGTRIPIRLAPFVILLSCGRGISKHSEVKPESLLTVGGESL